VLALRGVLSVDNFRELGDFEGLRQEFLQLNGFGWPGSGI
jgi:enoyl-[acyl-carrier protein] reductase / trans-2-enoyl-CoA reductase (NAD+)